MLMNQDNTKKRTVAYLALERPIFSATLECRIQYRDRPAPYVGYGSSQQEAFENALYAVRSARIARRSPGPFDTVSSPWRGEVNNLLDLAARVGDDGSINTRLRSRRAGVRTEPGLFLQMHNALAARAAFRQKTPLDTRRYLGIEIECFCKASTGKVGTALVTAGLGSYVSIVGDGSICGYPSGYEPMEVRVLVTEDELDRVVTEICKVLATFGAAVNKSCGLHVHIDARSGIRDREAVYRRLVRAQALLQAMVPASRRPGAPAADQYCGVVTSARWPTADWRQAARNRYKAINACSADKHGTIEVRIHSGTVSAMKIINWSKLLVNIVDGPDRPRIPQRISGIAKLYNLSPEMVEYVRERILKFKDATTVAFLLPSRRGRPRKDEVLTVHMEEQQILTATPDVRDIEASEVGPSNARAVQSSIPSPFRSDAADCDCVYCERERAYNRDVSSSWLNWCSAQATTWENLLTSALATAV